MTEKEAIYILRNAAWLGSDADRQKVEEAVEVVANAIEALNHSEIPNSFGEDTNVPSNDTISRQAAIELAMQYCPDDDGTCSKADEDIRNLLDELEDMPPAQPERKKGKWIDYTEYGYVECPFCKSATNCDGNKDELHFCFSCGADMREEEHTMEEFMYGQDMGSPEDGSL